MPELHYELVADNLQFPEGPVAMADGSVLVTEIKRRTITRVHPNGRCEVVAETGGGPNGGAIGPDGALYITNNGGSFEWIAHEGLTLPGPTPASHRGGSIQRLDLRTGALRTLYESCDDRPLIGPNDLVFDRSGNFWFTDHGCGDGDTHRIGHVHYASPDGSMIRRAAMSLIAPQAANGIGLSPDEKVLYVADTYLGRLWAFNIESPGQLRPMPPLEPPGRAVANLPGVQLLDSLAVEADGKVCVGTLINGGITVFDPDGRTEHYALPDPLCTNICFGGPDMRDAWITASGTGKLYKARWPRPGLKLNFNA